MTMTTLKTATALTAILAGSAMLLATAAMARGPGANAVDFAALDADGSGEITAEEFLTFKEDRIAAIDTNNDGIISIEELQAMGEARRAQRASARFEKMLDRFDTNEDGALSVQEFLAAGPRRGKGGDGIPRGMDTDNSGGVSAEEFAQAQERRGERTKQRRHGHGDGEMGKGPGKGGSDF